MNIEQAKAVLKSEIIAIVRRNGGEMVYRDLEAELDKSPRVRAALALMQFDAWVKKADAYDRN